MNAPAHTAVNPAMGEPHPRKPLKSIDIALGSLTRPSRRGSSRLGRGIAQTRPATSSPDATTRTDGVLSRTAQVHDARVAAEGCLRGGALSI